MAESFGIAGRGRFYDETGAIRDVIQNHLLLVVALLAMEPPITTYPESLRDEQVKVFRAIRPLTPENLVRGQFAGYHREEGVAPDSKVETFAALRLSIESWRWEGVPFFIRAGKSLPLTATEVVVELKRSPLARVVPGRPNYVRLRLGPQVSIALGVQVQRPGRRWATQEEELSVVRHPAKTRRMLMSDCSTTPWKATHYSLHIRTPWSGPGRSFSRSSEPTRRSMSISRAHGGLQRLTV